MKKLEKLIDREGKGKGAGNAKRYLSDQAIKQLCISVVTCDNYSFIDRFLRNTEARVGWCPVVDICSDVVGGNSLAPLFYCAFEDSTLQSAYLRGKHLICNPPFNAPTIEKFRVFCEELYR